MSEKLNTGNILNDDGSINEETFSADIEQARRDLGDKAVFEAIVAAFCGEEWTEE